MLCHFDEGEITKREQLMRFLPSVEMTNLYYIFSLQITLSYFLNFEIPVFNQLSYSSTLV
jgi:hypothetical protein